MGRYKGYYRKYSSNKLRRSPFTACRCCGRELHDHYELDGGMCFRCLEKSA